MDEKEKTLTRAVLKKEIIKKALEDNDFKKALLDSPKEALGRLGLKVPEEIEVKVVEETSRVVYLVLPVNPEEQLNDKQLDIVAGGCNAFNIPPGGPTQCPMLCETFMKF
ncbi:MAG: NHLP leader peptide family RiPP precursor [Peptococcaceae bacterium]|nr:NHLP leader peptide family RiPP precursor [Peptococcaceae bacterium]